MMTDVILSGVECVFVFKTVIIKSMERNVANMYEARRQLVEKDDETDVSVAASAATFSVADTFHSAPSPSAVFNGPGRI